MIFKAERASRFGHYWTVEIDSLEELAAWAREEKHEVIVDFLIDPPLLTIYDGYVE